jgi:hypothetical protein
LQNRKSFPSQPDAARQRGRLPPGAFPVTARWARALHATRSAGTTAANSCSNGFQSTGTHPCPGCEGHDQAQ